MGEAAAPGTPTTRRASGFGPAEPTAGHRECGLDVCFREAATLGIERPVGAGHAVEFNGHLPDR